MPDSFDPYLEWLSIPPGVRPPDHYALLGLKPFEQNGELISSAAEAQLARVRTIRPGENVRFWGQLIEEVEAAKSCLIDPECREAYDQTMPGAPVKPAEPAAEPEEEAPEASGGPGPAPTIASAPMIAPPPGVTVREPGDGPARTAPQPNMAMPPTMARPPTASVPDAAAPPAAPPATPAETPAQAPTPSPATAPAPDLAVPPGAAPVAPPTEAFGKMPADLPDAPGTPISPPTPGLATPPGAAPAEVFGGISADLPAAPDTPASAPTADLADLAGPPGSAPTETPSQPPAVTIVAAPGATPELAAPPGSPLETSAAAQGAATTPATTPGIAFPPGSTLGITASDTTVPDSGLDLASMNPSSPAAAQESPSAEVPPTPVGEELAAQSDPERLVVAQPLGSTGGAGAVAGTGTGAATTMAPGSVAPLGGPLLPMHSDPPPELLVVSTPAQPAPEPVATVSTARSLMRWMLTGALVMVIVVLGGILVEKWNSLTSEEVAADNGEATKAEKPEKPKKPEIAPLEPLPQALAVPLPMDPSTIDPFAPPLPPSNLLPPSKPTGPPPLTTDSPPPMLDPSLPVPSLPTLDPTTAPKVPGPSKTGGSDVPPPLTLDPVTGLPIRPSGPDPVPEQSVSGPVDPGKQATFRKAVAGVREAMANRDLAGVGTHIRTASFSRQTSEERDELARLKVMHHNLNEFWEGMREGVAELNNVGDIPLGETRIAIVESSPDHIVFRAYGRNKRYQTMDLPYPLVKFVANRWFSKNAPSSKAIIGTFLAVDPRGDQSDKNLARQYWQQATKGGVDCSDLMPELESTGYRRKSM